MKYFALMGRTVRAVTPVGAGFSASVQTAPRAHPAYCNMGTGSFPGVQQQGGGVDHQPHLVTYLLTPWSRVLLEKLTGSAASQEIPRIFGTRRFLTVFTSTSHMSVS
jgi:hypothetical protein